MRLYQKQKKKVRKRIPNNYNRYRSIWISVPYKTDSVWGVHDICTDSEISRDAALFDARIPHTRSGLSSHDGWECTI